MAEKPMQQEMFVYMSGYLEKRQRGKHIKRENQRKKLKFQGRYCVLNQNSLIYSKKENSKVRGSFPVERIKIVNDTDKMAFRKGTVSKPELCFQVGDEGEMLYLKASTEDLKMKWIDAFTRAAKEKGNVMLESYHSGVYGSKVTGTWSCCEKTGLQTPGCTPATLTGKTSLLTFNSVASDDTLISDTATSSSLQCSSSCESNMSGSVPERHLVPVIFEDRSSPPRPRAETLESGIDLNQSDVEKEFKMRRKNLLSTGSSEDDSDIALNHRYSSEDSIYGDEGIEPDKICVQRTNMGCESNQVVLPSGEIPHLVDSRKLPHSLTALVLQHGRLISGNGMLQIWDATVTSSLSLSLKVPGQTASLDIWRDYIAIGSSVVQLIQLNPSSEPKRILYARENDPLQSALDQSYLVAFLGDQGDLASAKVGGSRVDIWASPPCDSQIVLNPSSSVTMNEDGLLSLTASKDSCHPWVAAMTSCMKLHIIDWKASTVNFSLDLSTNLKTVRQNSSQVLSHISGMSFVVGNERKLQVLDGQTGNFTHSTEIENSISCLCCIKENYIAVGTTNGEAKIFSSQTDGNLKELYSLKDDKISRSVVAIAAKTDLTSVYVAHKEGVLNTWADHPVISSDLQNFQECIVGMQLCCEGILSHKRTFYFSNQESLTVSCADEDFYLHLPPEVLEYPKSSLEVAFASLGPVGAHFKFPEKLIPVSQAVWLCFSPQKEFNVPAKLKLSHCFECESLEDSQCLTLLKAENKDIKREENGYTSIAFSKVSKLQSNFHQDSQYYCTAYDNHFCIYCLAAEECSSEERVIGKINYCLTILKPKLYPTDQNLRIYCILHFNLKSCKKLVQEQTPDGYESVEKLLQFNTETESDRYKAALEIHINKAEAHRDGWVISMESENKIYAEDVNFFNYRNTGCLHAACHTSDIHKCYPHAYPPRFTLEVSSRYAKCYSTLKLVFSGARRDLSTEVQLHALRNERDLDRNGEDYLQRTHEDSESGIIPFIGTNGMWQRGE